MNSHLFRLEELAVGLQLEEKVRDVGEEHDDAARPRQPQSRSRVRCLLAGADCVLERQQQDVAKRTQQQKTGVHISLLLRDAAEGGAHGEKDAGDGSNVVWPPLRYLLDRRTVPCAGWRCLQGRGRIQEQAVGWIG